MDGLLLVTQGPKGSKGDLPIGISQNRSPRITCFFFGCLKWKKQFRFGIMLHIGHVVFCMESTQNTCRFRAIWQWRHLQQFFGVDGDSQADAPTICKLLKLTGCAT